MNKTVLARPMALVVGIVLIVGVTAAAAATTAEPRVDSIPTITDWRGISLPLDAYVQDFAERQTVLRAEYVQTKSCVEQFGF